MNTILPKRKTTKIYFVAAFAVIGVAVAVVLSALDQRSAGAEPDVFVSGGGSAFRASASEAMAVASSRTGLPIPSLKNDKFELGEINVQDDVEGVRLAVQTAQLTYQRRGAEPGKGRLTVGILTGRQSPAAAGRRVEPAPVPVANSAGLEMVRADLGESVGFTVWHGGNTHHIVFDPPWLSDSEMLEIVESLFR